MEASRDAILRALEEQRVRTAARVSALTRDLRDIIERSNEASRDDEHDPEGATIAFERAQVHALLEAAQARLQELDAARRRLTGETPLRCERCGEAIPEDRLLVRPTTRTCVHCADGAG